MSAIKDISFKKVLDPLGLFTKPDKPKAPPAPPEPAVIPTEDSEAVKAAKRRQLTAAAARSGRQSTILSGVGDTSDRLGG